MCACYSGQRGLFVSVDGFSEGLAKVSVSSDGGSVGYIDTSGKFVIPPRLSYGSSFHEGRAAVIMGGPCWITNGGSCARPEFRPAKLPANYDCRFAFIDRDGRAISELRFEDADDFSESFAPVRIGQRWGYVDRSGQIAITPQFESADPFSEGLAAVSLEGKTGFIDHSGLMVIPARFDSAAPFSCGRALVTENGIGGASRFIDKAGEAAFPGRYEAASSFSDGLAQVTLDGSFAWIDTSGRPVFTYSRPTRKRRKR